MEKQGNRPGLLADDFRRAVAGQLQVIHPMNLFLLHLVYQVGDGLGAWLRIRAAAGKRGPVSKSVLVCKVTERELVRNHDHMVPSLCHHQPEPSVQFLKLLNIGVCIGLETAAVRGRGFHQGLADDFHNGLGVHRGGPDMLIILNIHLMPIPVIVRMQFRHKHGYLPHIHGHPPRVHGHPPHVHGHPPCLPHALPPPRPHSPSW